MAGISESQLYRYIGGESSPTIEPLVQIARAAGVSLEWLATGYGSRRGGAAVPGLRTFEESLDLADLAPARRGPATGVEEAEAVTVAMFFQGVGVLVQELRLVPENLAIRLVRGDSMEPTLREGEPVLLDLSRRGAGEDGLYALLPPGARLPIYRRLQNLPSGAIRALCDNPSYRPFDFRLGHGEESPEIVGRIIWTARRF